MQEDDAMPNWKQPMQKPQQCVYGAIVSVRADVRVWVRVRARG